MDDETRHRFDDAMRDIYTRAVREANYNPTLYLRMLTEHGPLETARRLLAAPNPSSGFTTLWEKGRLDLTVEALVLETEFRELFTDHELDTASERLDRLGYRRPR